MDNIFLILQNKIDAVIIISGVVITISIILNAIKLSQQKSKILDTLNRKSTIATINKKTMEIHEYEKSENVTPETIRNYETEFNKVSSWYYVLEQFIPVFPLLGILGTVLGLMTQVSAKDIDALFNSLDNALTSTVFGLLFAIFLKMLVAITSTRIIKDVEILLDDYNEKYRISIDQKNIAEDN